MPQTIESDLVSLLKTTEFFKIFSTDILQHLVDVSAVRKYKRGTRIINIGDESHTAYVMISGSAKAFTEDDEGNEFVINTFTAGDCFGELSLLDNQQRTANVEITGSGESLVIPKAEFSRCIESDPKAAQLVIATLVNRIRILTDDISCLALLDVYGRITRLIQQSAGDKPNGTTEKMTHREIASRIGSSREMVGKILKELTTGEYISVENQQIKLLKKLPEKW